MHIKNLLKFTLTSFLAYSFFSSCSSIKDMSYNQKKIGHRSLYAYPDKLKSHPKDDDDRFKKLVVVGINDFNGKIEPLTTTINEKRLNKHFKLKDLSIGGISGVKAYLDIFDKKFPDQTLYLDSGSFMNTQNQHTRMAFLYKYLNLDAVNLGINEFNLNTTTPVYPSYLSRLFKGSNYKVLASNLFDLKEVENINWPNIQRSLLVTKNGLKVGVLGMISQEMANKKFSRKLSGVYVQNLAKTIITEANNLEKSGAQIIVLMLNHGIDCSSKIANELGFNKSKVNFNPLDNSSCEGNENEAVKVLSLIPPQMIDLVLSSGKTSKVANFIHDIPVLQSEGNGKYLSWAELYYDTKLKKVFKEDTRIHQPIQLCHQFIKESEDCYLEDEDSDIEIIPAKFLETEVIINKNP